MQNTNFPKYVLGILLISWIMAGCATPPTHDADPFEKFNRRGKYLLPIPVYHVLNLAQKMVKPDKGLR